MISGKAMTCISSEERNRGRFQKGASGNPGGRPKVLLEDGRSLAEVARAHTDDAIQVLVAVMEDRAAPSASRVAAATAVLDRGWGKPNQAVSIDRETLRTDAPTANISDERMASLMNILMHRVHEARARGELPGQPLIVD